MSGSMIQLTNLENCLIWNRVKKVFFFIYIQEVKKENSLSIWDFFPALKYLWKKKFPGSPTMTIKLNGNLLDIEFKDAEFLFIE